MNRRRETLADTLRRAADDMASQAPPAAVWDGLRERLQPRATAVEVALAPAAAGAVPPGRRWFAPLTPVALGAVALLAVSLLLMLRPAPPSVTVPVPAVDTGFMPVAAHDAWPAPGAAWLVRAELPRERLAEFGLPFDPTRAAERVPAQLLLRPDGAVLAVRVLARDGMQ